METKKEIILANKILEVAKRSIKNKYKRDMTILLIMREISNI